MEDARLWAFERNLWTGGAEAYHEQVDDEVVMVLPQPPYLVSGQTAIDMVADTPKWENADFADQQVSRPQEGLIVIGYRVTATRAGHEPYEARCTSVIRRFEHEVWRVVQHQQTPV